MITIKQAELKEIKLKSLVSLDKSLKLSFIININNDDLDINKLKELLYKPLVLNITTD